MGLCQVEGSCPRRRALVFLCRAPVPAPGPRKVNARRWPFAADAAGLHALRLTKIGVLAVRKEAILTGHGRVTEVILLAA